MKRVLIVDDNTDNLTVLSEMLKGHFETLTASSGREAIQSAVNSQPDAVVLDVNMPEMDGFEVCLRLHEQPSTRQIPIVMLTSLTGVDNRVKGLELGADDYILKPFHAQELIARINARVRRLDSRKREEADVIVGNLRLEPKSEGVWIDGEAVQLTQLEFELLRFFLEHRDEVISRARLLGDLWPDAVVSDRTVDTHVANLRKKIMKFNHPLTTIYGAGYILKSEA